ncbi:MAG: ATP-dependent DNA helicase RecQ [Chthoniobacterales bacterium]
MRPAGLTNGTQLVIDGRIPQIQAMDAHQCLARYFGFREFLDAQEEVIKALLAGEDALVVMPTGGGKSLCYQLPALLRDGVTVVVSPLIALMKDQVDALQRSGIAATLINSSLGAEAQRERVRAVARGEFKLVYVAPERFRSPSFVQALGETTIGLFAIDEAHCLSMWGHDFRPDYFRLNAVLEKLGRPQVAAFTATATPEVRADILQHLDLREPREFVAGFARPNLKLVVRPVPNEGAKFARLREVIREHRIGIVYCATRRRAEAVAAELQTSAVTSVLYHGGLSEQERAAAQDAFMSRRSDVVVATNAFGMGIDRADIRFVVHFELPGSIEAYYQEAGRAGRDGEAATCELLFNHADTRVQEFFIEGSNPSPLFITELYELLRREANSENEIHVSQRDLAQRVGADGNDLMVGAALHILDREGYIDRFDIPGKRMRGTRLLNPGESGRPLKIDAKKLAEKERRDRSKLKTLVDFAYARLCRQQSILRYFGEHDPGVCGNCDVCLDRSAPARPPTEEEALVVRKALSGVARMSSNTTGGWQARFGRGRIVQTLVGSRSREILEARLDQLSTYGLLKAEGVGYLNQLFRELQQAGLVVTTPGDYPKVTLTARGAEVMKGRSDYELHWPSMGASAPEKGRRGAKRRAKSASEIVPVDEELLERLKSVRRDLARQNGNSPAYLIFSDETLRAFARLKPRSEEAGRQIRGVGEIKAARYLPRFIQEIAAAIE